MEEEEVVVVTESGSFSEKCCPSANQSESEHEKRSKNSQNDGESETGSFVISGLSGRFPEAENLEEFQQHLFSGTDMVTDDGRRWAPGLFGLPTRSGKLKSLDKFDANFFQVHHKQANFMDPQLRMLLEVVYESIIDSGTNPLELRGSRTGVFVGASCSESEIHWATDSDCRHGYTLTGCTRGMFSNRISYAFDFNGPSVTVDTACSSSFVALHHALTALRAGNCDSAIVAGTHICLSPQMCQQFQRMNMLAKDGKCRSFDASGAGYVRSEAVVAIFIQKTDLARRNYASLLAASTNTDGYKGNGVTFPSGKMQQQLLEEAYREAQVDPVQLSYVEAHGTGTQAGDPQEVNAIAQALCPGREKDNPLLIGSVKSNMGHAEPVSGLCALAKVLVSMLRGELPANLHFETPNPNIPSLTDGRIKVVTKNTEWSGGIVGLNCFGFGGANVHVILKSNPKKKSETTQESSESSVSLPILIPFSGRTPESVEFALNKINQRIGSSDSPFAHKLDQIALVHKISEKNIPGHKHRGFLLMSPESGQEIHTEVQEVSWTSNAYTSSNLSSLGPPSVWFVFNGMGGQYPGMGRDLLRLPICRESLENSARLLYTKFNIDLLDILVNGTEETFENVLYSFVSITAVQIALVDLLRSLAIHPDGIIGHSAGELGCAYADGCLTSEQVILCAHARGQAILDMNKNRQEGQDFAMAAVGLTWTEALEKCPPSIFPACHNAKDSVTVSGPAKDIATFVNDLKNQGIFAKEVNSSGQAFHSKYIEPARSQFKSELDKIIPIARQRSSRWVSTSIPEGQWDTPLAIQSGADYHVNNLISPVLFQEALTKVPEDSIVIEIGPHALLAPILKRSLPTCQTIGLLHRNQPDNSIFLLKSIGKLYNCGLNPKVSCLYPPVQFPVAIDTPPLSPLVQFDHSQSWNVPHFTPCDLFSMVAKSQGSGKMNGIEFTYEVDLNKESDEFYRGHKIDGRILFPGTGMFLLVWKAFAALHNQSFDQMPIVLEQVRVLRAVLLDHQQTVNFSVSILKATGEYQISESGNLIGCGTVRAHRTNVKNGSEFLPVPAIEIPESDEDERQQTTGRIPLSSQNVYKELRLRGYDYVGEFKGVERTDPEAGWAQLNFTGNWVTFLDTMLQACVLYDTNRALLVPSSLERAVFDPLLFVQSLKFNSKGGEDDEEDDESEENDGKDEKNKGKTIVPIFHYPELKVVACEGIQFQGWKSEIAPRRIQASTVSNLLQIEKFQFAPYFDQDDTRIATENSTEEKFLDVDSVLGVCTEIIQENMIDFKMTMLEILGEEKKSENTNNAENPAKFPTPLSPAVHFACLDRPTKLCDGTAVFLCSKPEPKSPSKTQTTLDQDHLEEEEEEPPIIKKWRILHNAGIPVHFLGEEQKDLINEEDKSCSKLCSIINQNQVDLLLLSGDQDEKLMRKTKDILQAIVKPQGFLLFSRQQNDAENNKKVMKIEDYEKLFGVDCVAHKIASDKTHFYLFRKVKPISPVEFSIFVVEIDSGENSSKKISERSTPHSKKYDWILPLKEAMKKCVDNSLNHRIYVVAREGCLGKDNFRPTGILGLVNCLRKEPGGEAIRCFFLRSSSQNIKGTGGSNLNGLNFHRPNKNLEQVLKRDLTMNVFDERGVWGSNRFFRLDHYLDTKHQRGLKEVEYAHINVVTRGDLSSLRWFESPLKYYEPKSDLCRVHYASLNFRDIMLATGKLPLDSLPHGMGFKESTTSLLGLEFSGTKGNTRIMGVVGSCESSTCGLATNVLVDPELSWEIPEQWSLSQAATVPVAYSTAFYALIVRGQMKPGESVLIHAGSGGVGQAAIRIALSMNCTVYTTVGSPEKRSFLRSIFPQLKDSSFANSRDTSFLEHIMKETRGLGVDLVLNSLAEEKLQASIRCLAQNGRFLEIGKVDLFKNNRLGLQFLLKNVNISGILLDALLPGDPDRIKIRELLQEGIKSGVVVPLPATIFQDNLDEIEQAFRFMASGKHVGKVLIQVRKEEEKNAKKLVSALPRSYFDPSKSYIVIGGLGGFGLEMVNWLIERGARALVLVSRSGVKNGYQDYRVRKWRKEGTSIFIANHIDVGTLDGITNLLQDTISHFKGMKIGGIFNLALILADGLLENQTTDKFDTVCRVKIDASIALDKMSRILAPALQYFVVFSSLSSGRGAAGLSNYSYANSAMERICEQRRKEGLPALAIQWGAVGDVGVLYEDKGVANDAVIGGTAPQRIASCLSCLDVLFHEGVSKSSPSPVLACAVLANKSGTVASTTVKGVQGDLSSSATLTERVAHILGMKPGELAKVNKQTMLIELGMDSLMAVEIFQCIQMTSGLTLAQSEMLELTFARIEQIHLMANKNGTNNSFNEAISGSTSSSSSSPGQSLPSSLSTSTVQLDSISSSSTKIDLASSINGANMDFRANINASAPAGQANRNEEIGISVEDEETIFETISECKKPLIENGDKLSPVFQNGGQTFGQPNSNKKGADNWKDDYMDVPPASSSCLSKLRRSISFFLIYLLSLTLFSSMILSHKISIFLRLFVQLYLHIFRSPNEIRLMDRRLDQTCKVNSRLSNVIFTAKFGGVPKKSRIIKIIDERIARWKVPEDQKPPQNDDLTTEGESLINRQKEGLRFNREKTGEASKPYDILHWKARKGWLFCYWEHDLDFDVENHIIFQNCEPSKLQEETMKLVEFYHAYKWEDEPDHPDERPQWEMRFVVPTYPVNFPPEQKEFMIIISLHHSYGDGFSMLELLQEKICDTPLLSQMAAAQNSQNAAQIQKIMGLVPSDQKQQGQQSSKIHMENPTSCIFKPWTSLKENVQEVHRILLELCRHWSAVNYHFKLSIPEELADAPRKCGVSKFRLSQLKGVRSGQGKLVPMNAVVLSCISRAYERIFGESRRELPKSLVAGMPFIIHQNKEPGLVNSVAGNVAEVPLNIPDSWDRLSTIQYNVDECCKREVLESIWHWIPHLTSIINPIQSYLFFSAFPSPNIIYSNMPASLPRHLTFFGGFKLKDFAGFPALFSRAHAGMASSIDSFNDTLSLTLVLDQCPLDISPDFIPQFFKYFQQELDHLTSQ